MEIPRATYRLQFNEHFRLTDALALVPYLAGLGISHLYASPLFKACPHSAHGYDVCDFSRLNTEIGAEGELKQLAAALQAHGMGLVLDIVPNHMGINTPENTWWWDVLKNGRASRYADYFDIDWEPADLQLRGKILLPVLGDQYEKVLERGDLKIEENRGEPVLTYFENTFPLAADTRPRAAIEKMESAALHDLISKQHYRLAFWGEGDRRLNYRRFFAVSTLAGIRVEEEQVFNDSHALLGQWLKNKWLDGVRVDHPDGLRDPKEYLERLRALTGDQWIIVEKILQPHEALPRDWPIQGTVGYDFLNQANGVFIQSKNEKAVTDFYAEFTCERVDAKKMVLEKKRLVLETLFTTEVNRLVDMLLKLAPRHSCREFPRQQWREALIEFVAIFPVYRTYIRGGDNAAGESNFHFVGEAAARAMVSRPDLSPNQFDFISGLMLLLYRGDVESDFVARAQQLCGPAMAKGVEDTAFYCLNRLASINEVGGDPGRFGVSIDEFHEFCRMRQARWPHTMLASSTHDTKRSEDVRARINVLSEIPGAWREAVLRWSRMNERHRNNDFPDRHAEYLLYQTLAGAWPLPLPRVLAYMDKASCEAKQHTDWNHRNKNYDQALKNFITSVLADENFIQDLEQFVSSIADAAMINSLSQTLLKLTAPGVPDIYQGNELLDFSLVDPDNRRPVDFELRKKSLDQVKTLAAEEVWGCGERGLSKLWLIYKTLSVRARNEKLFKGGYQPLVAQGETADHLVAFSRGGDSITIVPRFTMELKSDWKDLAMQLPPGDWRNEFTGETVSGKIFIAGLLQKFPAALLIKGE